MAGSIHDLKETVDSVSEKQPLKGKKRKLSWAARERLRRVGIRALRTSLNALGFSSFR